MIDVQNVWKEIMDYKCECELGVFLDCFFFLLLIVYVTVKYIHHCSGYHLCNLLYRQVSAAHLKIGHP